MKKILAIFEIVSAICIFISIYIVNTNLLYFTQHTEDHSMGVMRQATVMGVQALINDGILDTLQKDDNNSEKAKLIQDIRVFLTDNHIQQMNLYLANPDGNDSELQVSVTPNGKDVMKVQKGFSYLTKNIDTRELFNGHVHIFAVNKNGHRISPQSYREEKIIAYYSPDKNILCEVVFSVDQMFKIRTPVRWALTANSIFTALLILCMLLHLYLNSIRGTMLKRAIHKHFENNQ